MPLPESEVKRELRHRRTIECKGYERDDGLWDIDGWLTDIKTYDFPNMDRGEVKAGEPLHGMGIRVTIDENMIIHKVIAVTDYSPFSICGNITPNFNKLEGLRIGRGFNKAVRELLGGVEGCTHLVDLLGPIATTAFQTLVPRLMAKLRQSRGGRDRSKPPPTLNTCHAWASDSAVVRRDFPDHYNGE